MHNFILLLSFLSCLFFRYHRTFVSSWKNNSSWRRSFVLLKTILFQRLLARSTINVICSSFRFSYLFLVPTIYLAKEPPSKIQLAISVNLSHTLSHSWEHSILFGVHKTQNKQNTWQHLFVFFFSYWNLYIIIHSLNHYNRIIF